MQVAPYSMRGAVENADVLGMRGAESGCGHLSQIWMKPKKRSAACYADQALTEHPPIR